MIKNIKPFLILFVFLIGCGFSPVLKSSKIDFSIEKIETFGDKKINEKIISGLENYKNNIDKKKKYYLNIISSQNKIITSKDTKGDPKTYKIEICKELIINTSARYDFENGNILSALMIIAKYKETKTKNHS